MTMSDYRSIASLYQQFEYYSSYYQQLEQLYLVSYLFFSFVMEVSTKHFLVAQFVFLILLVNLILNIQNILP